MTINAHFSVRAYVNGSAPVVFQGGSDPLGVYIETRPASGSGHTAIPSKRVNVPPELLKPLPSGSDADFEYVGPFPAKGAF
jgi:hypothetical protein